MLYTILVLGDHIINLIKFNTELESIKKLRSIVGIASIEDYSDINVQRARINFTNGLSLNVVQGQCTYGANLGLYEIAVFNHQGQFDQSYFEPEDQTGDQVLGWCDERKVEYYIDKLRLMNALTTFDTTNLPVP